MAGPDPNAEFGSSAEVKDVVFKSNVLFHSTKFRGNAIFHSTRFGQSSQPSFRAAQFLSGAYFQGAKFDDPTEFTAIHFDGEVRFNGAVFQQKASFAFSVFREEVDFASTDGSEAAMFKGWTSFEHARFERHVNFSDVVFAAEVVFREAYLSVALFSSNGRVGNREQFASALDLNGCTYERIRVDWSLFLKKGDGTSRLPQYDQQPYDQLEKMFHSASDDRTAQEVYLERRRVARLHLRETDKWSWMRDSFYWGTLNYGVRPYHLILYALIAIGVGTWAFHSPGAVQESPASTRATAANISTKPLSASPKQLSLGDAARLSLRFFLPVSTPLESNVEPTKNRWGPLKFSDLAALLSIVGWIIVPVGIAATTGLLRRVAK